MKPRRHRMTCYMPRMWKQAETNIKRCARSDRATRSSASTNLSPCENSISLPSACFPSGVPAPKLSLSGCFFFMDNGCCRPCYPRESPSTNPKQSWEIILSNFAKVLSHISKLKVWKSPRYGAAYAPLWTNKYCWTAEVVCSPWAQGKRETIKPKWKQLDFFYFEQTWP